MVETSERQEASPGRQTRVAVIGCGYWGKNIVRNLAELGALAAVCDEDRQRAEAMASLYRVPVVGWEEILADPGIGAVAIVVPAVLHYRLARQALEAGKHVFVEKPMTFNLSEAEHLCVLAEQWNLRLMVGHLLQYHSAFLKLRQLVQDQEFGRLLYIYSTRLNLGKIRREEDILWSFAPHDVSMILSLINEDPEHVTAVGAYYLHGTIADVTTTHLRFPAGEQAHIFVSWLHPVKEQRLVVVGSKAMAVFDDGEPWPSKLRLYRHKISWDESVPLPHKAEAEMVAVAACEPLKAECRHFLDCIASGDRPRTDGREGVRVLRVLAQAAVALKAIAPPTHPKA